MGEQRVGQVTIDVARGPSGLLGRAAELQTVTAAIGRAQLGKGAVVLVSGKPGTGKSSLLGAARSLGDEGGLRTLEGAGQELERDHPFALALQLFDPLMRGIRGRERAKLLAGPAALAAPLFSDGPASRLVDEDLAGLLHGLFHLSVRTAAMGPLAVLVDDAQFADEPSLRFLLHLAARIEGLPALLVAVEGHGGDKRRRRLVNRLAASPATTVVRLGPLSLSAVSERLGSASRPALAKAVYSESGGNPFLVNELVASLAASGAGERSSRGALERLELGRVREWTLQVLQQSGTRARRLAEVLALLGDGAEPRHAAELAGLDEAQTTALADQLIEAGLLSGERQLSFAQPVVRRALLAGRPPGELGDAQREAARMLRRDAAAPERVAAHLLEAGYAGEDWVVDALLEAAKEAVGRGDPRSGVLYLRRALAEPPSIDRRARVLLELGRAEALAGDSQAVAHLTDAMEQISDPGARALAALDAGRALYLRGLPLEAVTAFLSGLEAAPDGEKRLQLRVALETVARLSAASEAAAVAGPGGEPSPTSPGRRLLLAQRAFEGGLRGIPRDEVADLAVRALSGDRLVELETADGVGIYLAATALMLAEELGAAEQALSLALDDASRRGSVLSAATAAYLRSHVRLRRGHLAAAEVDARHAVSARRFGWRMGLPGAHGVLSDLELASGHPDGAESALAAGEEELSSVDHTARAAYLARRGNWRLATGDAPGALTDFLDCGGAWTAVGARSPCVFPWRSRAALALAEIGDPDGGRRLVEEELDLARAIGAPGAEGRALHALGHVQGGQVEAFEQAVACLERTEFSLDLAHALVDLGRGLRRAQRRNESREPLRRALDVAGRCGAGQLVRRAEHELGAAGARPRRQAVSGLAALTPRERQVARLASQGMSNREIAETLYVTVKTVEWHIRHLFEKLSVDARQELRAALEEGSGEEPQQ